MNMRNLLFFGVLFFVYSCGDSEFTKFDNRIIVMETLSETEGLSSNVLSSYIDSIAIIKAQISLSKVEESYKDSLNNKLNSVYYDLRASRAFNCIKDKTLWRTNSLNRQGDKVRTKVQVISKDSVIISHTYEMGDVSAWRSLIAGLANKESNVNIPKNNSHRKKILWVSSDDDNSSTSILISPDENEDKNHEYDPFIIDVNEIECKYKILK